MSLTDVLAFMCGSLMGLLIASVIYMRSMHKMPQMIRRLLRLQYMRGWRDGNDARWKPQA